MIVVDGLNVARNHGVATADDELGFGSARALVAVIQTLHSRGWLVHAILPTWALDGGKGQQPRLRLQEAHLLLPYLHHCVHLSPARTDDDEFVIGTALETNGLVLTNDRFRDHQQKGMVSSEWVAARCVRFMFVGGTLLVKMPRAAAPAPSTPAERRPPLQAVTPPPNARHATRPARRLAKAQPLDTGGRRLELAAYKAASAVLRVAAAQRVSSPVVAQALLLGAKAAAARWRDACDVRARRIVKRRGKGRAGTANDTEMGRMLPNTLERMTVHHR